MEIPSFRVVSLCGLITVILAAILVCGGYGLPTGRTLDFVFTQAELKHLIGQYSKADFETHLWLTSRIDMFFPLAYGAFFYFAARRYANAPWVYLLIIWVLVGTIFDFTENAVLLNILKGDDGSALKTVYTRAKFVFLVVPIVFCTTNFILDIISGGNRKVRQRS